MRHSDHDNGQDAGQHNARLDRIRKLLAQAESPACTEAEAATFNAKAAELMARYGVDEALLAQTAPGRDVVGDRIIDLHAPYAREKGTLGARVAAGLRCRSALRTVPTVVDGSARNKRSLHLFGHEGDLRLVEMLYTSLLVQGTRDVVRAPVPPWEGAAAYRRTWWLGFADAIGHRLADAERAAARAAEPEFAERGTSAAVVLADRATLAEHALQEAYPRLRAAAPRWLSGSGHDQGYASGQRADLGRDGRLAGARRALSR
jgi:hypothetical protein